MCTRTTLVLDSVQPDLDSPHLLSLGPIIYDEEVTL